MTQASEIEDVGAQNAPKTSIVVGWQPPEYPAGPPSSPHVGDEKIRPLVLTERSDDPEAYPYPVTGFHGNLHPRV